MNDDLPLTILVDQTVPTQSCNGRTTTVVNATSRAAARRWHRAMRPRHPVQRLCRLNSS